MLSVSTIRVACRALPDRFWGRWRPADHSAPEPSPRRAGTGRRSLCPKALTSLSSRITKGHRALFAFPALVRRRARPPPHRPDGAGPPRHPRRRRPSKAVARRQRNMAGTSPHPIVRSKGSRWSTWAQMVRGGGQNDRSWPCLAAPPAYTGNASGSDSGACRAVAPSVTMPRRPPRSIRRANQGMSPKASLGLGQCPCDSSTATGH